MSELCRLCASSTSQLIDMFSEEASTVNILYKVHIHLPIKVTQKDLLPHTMCLDCWDKLDMFHEFVVKCWIADSELKTMLGLEEDNQNSSVWEKTDVSFVETLHEPKETLQDTMTTLQEATIQEGCEYIGSESSELTSENNSRMLHGILVNKTNSLVQNISEDAPVDVNQSISEDTPVAVENCNETFLVPVVDQSISEDTPVAVVQNISEDMPVAVDQSISEDTPVAADNYDETFLTGVLDQSISEDTPVAVQSISEDAPVAVHNCDETIKEEKYQKFKVFVIKSKIPNKLTSGEIFNILKTRGHEELDNDNFIVDSTSEKELIRFDADHNKNLQTTSEDVDDTSEISSHDLEKENIFECFYCSKTIVGEDNLLSHQTSEHPDKVFVCTVCNPKVVVYESKDIFDNHMLLCHPNNKVSKQNLVEEPIILANKTAAAPPDQISLILNDAKNAVLECTEKNTSHEKIIAVNQFSDDFISNVPFQVTEENICNEEDINDTSVQYNGVEITSVFKVHVESSEKVNGNKNSKARLKMTKGFDNVSKNVQSAIMKTLQEMVIKSESKKNSTKATKKLVKSIKRKLLNSSATRKRKELKNNFVNETCNSNSEKFMCEICSKVFYTKSGLMNHMDKHNTSTFYPCKKCDKVYSSKICLRYHKKYCNLLKVNYICDICGKSIKHLQTFEKHKLSHTDPDSLKRFSCQQCEKSFRSRHTLKEHQYVHTNMKPHECPDCPKTFRTLSLLKQHSSVHMASPRYQCEICKKSFTRKAYLITHQKMHKPDNVKNYKCKICSMSFEAFSDLLSHRSTHTLEEKNAVKNRNNDPQECHICGKMLSCKKTLRSHLLKHESELNPNRCYICGKSYSNKTTLDIHYRKHTGEKPFCCEMCGLSFSAKVSLLVHTRLHTGETPYTCNTCDKGFRSKSALNQHKDVHSKERSFKCSQCTKSFKRRDALVSHFRIHTNERPFTCHVCGQGFRQQGDRKKHEQTHYNNYACTLCSRKFKEENMLSDHLVQAHTINTSIVINEDNDLADTEQFVLDALDWICTPGPYINT